MTSERLAGKLAFISGSTSGLGRAAALRCAREGARVIVSGRSVERGKSVVSDIRGYGADAVFVPMDVTDEDQVARAVAAGIAQLGEIDCLVNNAAWTQGPIVEAGPVTDISLETWERIIRTNLTGTFLVSKHVLPSLIRAGGGSVVNVASTAAIKGDPGLDAYTASKGAVVSLTRSMAAYYRRHGIRVNCLVPGFFDTGESRVGALVANPDTRAAALRYYNGRLGRPEEFASACVYFLSDESAFTNATTLVLDNGSTVLTDIYGYASESRTD